MGAEPTVDVARLRRHVREVLNMAPGFAYTERALAQAVRELTRPAAVDIHDLRGAVEWNQMRGFIDYRANDDLDADEWFITARGIAKERTGE